MTRILRWDCVSFLSESLNPCDHLYFYNVNITLKTTDQFKDKVEELVKKYPNLTGGVFYDKILKELYEYAFTRSGYYIPAHYELAQKHNGTGMNYLQTDYNMVFLSAMLISWAV